MTSDVYLDYVRVIIHPGGIRMEDRQWSSIQELLYGRLPVVIHPALLGGQYPGHIGEIASSPVLPRSFQWSLIKQEAPSSDLAGSCA